MPCKRYTRKGHFKIKARNNTHQANTTDKKHR